MGMQMNMFQGTYSLKNLFVDSVFIVIPKTSITK